MIFGNTYKDIFLSRYMIVIVESPSKCKKIESYLGSGYTCIATYGHICEIDVKKGIDPTMKPHYAYTTQARSLKSKVKGYKDFILATDDDREGEGIAYHVCRLLKLPLTTPRIRFHEITKEAIQRAMGNLGQLNMNWVHAQQARQLMDFHVGFTVSPLLWKQIGPKLSAGRCQTPCLRMVYDHSVTPDVISYETTGYFTNKKIPFVHAKLHTPEEIESFLEMRKSTYELILHPPIQKVYAAPLPLTTVHLQQISGMSPTLTMKVAQSLYEQGYITYMRTDSKTYSQEFSKKLLDYIQEIHGESVGTLPPHTGAHEAIHPTSLGRVLLDGDEKKLYDRIFQHTIESGMTACKVDVLHASIDDFHYRHEEIREAGWKGCKKTESYFTYLSHVKKEVCLHKLVSRLHLTRSTLLTEIGLIHKMESYGIGRPSTYASLVEKIQEKGYVQLVSRDTAKVTLPEYTVETECTKTMVEKEFGSSKKGFVIQPLGKQVIEFLQPLQQFSYEYTSTMESYLDAIAKGDMDWSTVCKECYQLCKESTLSIAMVPLDAEHTYLVERHVVEHQDGTTWKVKPEINADTIQEYALEDTKLPRGRYLGEYEQKPLYLTRGSYGLYAIWGDNTRSLKHILPKYESTLTYEYVIQQIHLRVLSGGASVRKGKYGPYLDIPGKPFISLRNCKDYLTCSEEELLSYGRV